MRSICPNRWEVENNEPTLYKAAETDLVPTLLEFFDVQATRMAWQ